MQPEDFTSPLAGACVRTVGGYWAFLPASLPRSFDINPVWEALGAADAALGAMAGLAAGPKMPYQHMLLAAAVRREAVLSSRIEGIQTRLSDLLRAEVEDPDQTGPDQMLRETRNYVTAIDEGVRRLGAQPIAGRLVRELHAVLLNGVRGQEKTPGEFRRLQNFIGGTADTPQTARYVPPPPERVPDLIADWEQFVNARGIMPDLVQCALMHEHFEAIHPFNDGNGRIGRLLIPLFLIERGRLAEPLLYVSDFIEANRREYYDRLQAVRTHGEWTPWVRFFLAGVADASRKAVRQAAALNALRDELRARFIRKPTALLLLDRLFTNPYVTNALAAQQLDMDRKTAQKPIDLMQSERLLEEVTGREWGRVWVARPILDVIENPPRE